jgi:hypothetical protein
VYFNYDVAYSFMDQAAVLWTFWNGLADDELDDLASGKSASANSQRVRSLPRHAEVPPSFDGASKDPGRFGTATDTLRLSLARLS